jgi:hypothetical protein
MYGEDRMLGYPERREPEFFGSLGHDRWIG